MLDPDLAWRLKCLHHQIRCDAAAQKVLRLLREIRDRRLQEKYRPDQPRAPRGTPIGGQWIVDPSSARQQALHDERVQVAQFDGRGPIDLLDHEGVEGGHTVAVHVGKSDAYMLARVGGGSWFIPGISGTMRRSGSFSSLATANKLVNATLAKNKGIVEFVAAGILSDAFITAEFGSITGREAYRPSATAKPYMRTTTGVGVLIVHDASFPGGFRIITAYPRSE